MLYPNQACNSYWQWFIGTIEQMLDRTKQSNLSHKMMIRLNSFLYLFTLREGTIVIAFHQITLLSFILSILLGAISHLGELLSMMQYDMEDDADRYRLYVVAHGKHLTYHKGEVIITNNQRRFAKAQHLASVTVIILYTSTIVTAIYLMCCISLMHGALKYKREYVLPWITASCIGIVVLIPAIIVGNSYPCVYKEFGGYSCYHFISAVFIITFIYAICTVSSFALEIGSGRCARAVRASSDERGERLLLLDHAAHSSLLSAAQLDKLNSGTGSQFV